MTVKITANDLFFFIFVITSYDEIITQYLQNLVVWLNINKRYKVLIRSKFLTHQTTKIRGTKLWLRFAILLKKTGLVGVHRVPSLNDNQRISVRTRRQVKEIAEDMGYQPNYNARNLTNQEANSVGVIFPVNNRVVDNIFFTLACCEGLMNS